MILVDMSHLFFRNFWMSQKDILEFGPCPETGKSKPTGKVNTGYMAHLMFASVLVFAKKFGASESNPLVIAMDSKPSWRHDWYVKNSRDFPEYKIESYKGDRTKDDEIPWDAVWESFEAAVEVLEKNSDFAVVKVDKTEADDIVAVLGKDAGLRGEQVYVCSSDKDFYQLQTENVHIYNPITKIIIPKMDVNRYKQMHILVAGDDNIKAVKPRCGEKTAEKMLPELNTILQTNPDIRARYEFNRTLIDFEYIPDGLQASIRQEYIDKEHLNHSPTKLLGFFSKYQMRQMAVRIPEFKLRGKAHIKPKLTVVTSTVADKAEASIESFFS